MANISPSVTMFIVCNLLVQNILHVNQYLGYNIAQKAPIVNIEYNENDNWHIVFKYYSAFKSFM